MQMNGSVLSDHIPSDTVALTVDILWPGEYCFEICAVGDGVTYATQMVCIVVEGEIEIVADEEGEAERRLLGVFTL